MNAPNQGGWVVYNFKDNRWNKEGVSCGKVRNGAPKNMWDWIDYCKQWYPGSLDDVYFEFDKHGIGDKFKK